MENQSTRIRVRHPKAQGQKIVAVIGGGFAGLTAAQTLAKEPDILTVLIDQRNYHLFQPLLYQVATAGLNPSEIAVPIRSEFADNKNVEVYLKKAQSVNLGKKFINIDQYEFEFDYLIIACGSIHSYFGHPEWEEFAPGLKNLEQAVEIRRRILLAFEDAENEPDPEKQKQMLTFVVVGGGPTGVELAGAIAEISRTVVVKDFKRINPASACVLLVEGSPEILETFDNKLSQHARADLAKLGVEIKLSSYVTNITAEGVTIGQEFIPTQRVFWAAGVSAVKIGFEPQVELGKGGRVKVSPDFSIPGYPDVFVVGDMASYFLPTGAPLPGLAPAAIQSGKYVAKLIINKLNCRATKPFRYLDKGQMATIGKHKAIAQSGRIKLHGFIAWLMWLFVHLLHLIGFKNRIVVVLQWAWNYLFSKRGARLITGRDWKITKSIPQ